MLATNEIDSEMDIQAPGILCSDLQSSEPGRLDLLGRALSEETPLRPSSSGEVYEQLTNLSWLDQALPVTVSDALLRGIRMVGVWLPRSFRYTTLRVCSYQSCVPTCCMFAPLPAQLAQ